MGNENEIKLTPGELNQESEILFNFQNLLKTEKFRYESQAYEILAGASLSTKVVGYDLSYLVTPENYVCRIVNQDNSGNNYEIQVPIPDSRDEKIAALVELFAQSESGLVH